MLERTTVHLLGKTLEAFTTTERVILTIGSTLCLLTTLWLARALNIPSTPDFAGSMLAAPPVVLNFLIIAIAVLICTFLGTIIAAFLRIEAGLFCVTVGLAALSVRGGPVHAVLQYASGPSIFLTMAMETILLAAMVAGAWVLLPKLYAILFSAHLMSAAKDNAIAPIDDDSHDETRDILFAIAIQIVVMILCEMLLLQSDAKKQVLTGVGLSALIATIAASQSAPLVDGIYYWLVPSVVAVIGYVFAYLYPEGFNTGETHGLLAPLVRALPLDYVSVGTAGAILGFWTSRTWKEESEPA